MVTGGARRVGAAIVRHLHHLGWHIILHCHHSVTEAEALVTQCLASRADSAQLIRADLSDMAAIPKLLAQAQAVWGRLDALVNNASIFFPTPLARATEHEWQQLMTLNLQAPFFLAQAAYPHLLQSEGSLVNITDANTAQQTPVRDYGIYGISKAGLCMLTRVFAKEWAPLIRVNAVAPGAVAWPEGDASLNSKIKDKILAKTALARAGSVQDVATAVAFLLNEANYITGQTLHVDGGRF